jgi:hypothetical protein
MGARLNSAQHRPRNGWIIAGPALAVTVVLGIYCRNRVQERLGPAWILNLPCIVLFATCWVVGTAVWRHGCRWFFRRQRIALYLACLVGIGSLVTLFYAEESWRGKRAWAAATRDMASKGETFSLASIIPPELPATENFAAAPVFSALFDTEPIEWGPAGKLRFRNPEPLNQLRGIQLPMSQRPYCRRWFQTEFVDLALWANYFRTNAGGAADPTDPARGILRALSQYDALFTELRSASRRPSSRFPVQYEKGLLAQNPQLRIINDLSQVLSLRSVAELAAGKSAEALDDINLSFRLAAAVKKQPGFLAQYGAQEILLNSLQPVWEGLARRRWSETQLQDLQQQITGLNVLADFDVAWRSELILWADLGNKVILAKKGHLAGFLPGLDESWLRAYPEGWVYQNQAGLYRFYQEIRRVVDLPTQRVDVAKGKAAMARLVHDYFANDPAFSAFCLPKLNLMCHSGITHFAFTQTALNQASLACGLERFRLETGEFPDQLEQLMPRYLTRLPLDVLTGQPLRYRRIDTNRFELYSLGWNGTDEGGRPAPLHFDFRGRLELWRSLAEGDWIWSYPAE